MLATPFVENINPFVDDIQHHTLKWVLEFELVTSKKLFKMLEIGRFNELTARCYPNSSYEILQVINDWMTWLFILDDLFDEEGIGRQPDEMLVYCTDILNLFNYNYVPDERCDSPMFVS